MDKTAEQLSGFDYHLQPQQQKLVLNRRWIDDWLFADDYNVLPECNLDTTVDQVKAMIRTERGYSEDITIFLYKHGEEEIRCPESRMLRQVFGKVELNHVLCSFTEEHVL